MADGWGGKRKGAGRKTASDESEAAAAYLLFQKSRAKEKQHQAELAALRAKRQKGQLLDARRVKVEADAAARMVKNAFLALPDRVASLLVGRSEGEILDELRKEINATLEMLSRDIGGDK